MGHYAPFYIILLSVTRVMNDIISILDDQTATHIVDAVVCEYLERSYRLS